MVHISLPSEKDREEPILKPATQPGSDPNHEAAFIFIHGLADSGAALENVADQFRSLSKLPHLNWIFPSAKHNPLMNETGWYVQHSLSPLAPSRPELAPEEDESGMLDTVAYIETLLDACVAAGIPAHRIVLGGFSQGCAMSLLLHLTSKRYAGELAGVVGLLGYMPLVDGKRRLHEMREGNGLVSVGTRTPVFMARGMRDTLVPKRVWTYTLQGLRDAGVEEDVVERHEYEGLTHTLHGPLLTDLCEWLERVVPGVE